MALGSAERFMLLQVAYLSQMLRKCHYKIYFIILHIVIYALKLMLFWLLELQKTQFNKTDAEAIS